MVQPSMDLLELLRERGMDGDVDFLREALRVLVDGIMDAEVSATPRFPPRSALSTANAARSGGPTATGIATAPGLDFTQNSKRAMDVPTLGQHDVRQEPEGFSLSAVTPDV